MGIAGITGIVGNIKIVGIEITQSPALGTVRLIARRMLYVKCVGLCFRNLHVELHTSFFKNDTTY